MAGRLRLHGSYAQFRQPKNGGSDINGRAEGYVMSAITVEPARRDVRVISLIGIAHGASHYYQLAFVTMLLIVRDSIGVLGAVFYGVSGFGQTVAGFAVDRFGARPILAGGLAALGLSLGLVPKLDRDEPQVLKIYEKLVAACKKRGQFAGIHNGTATYAAKAFGMGFQLCTIANDSGLLSTAAKGAVNTFRKEVGAAADK